MAISFERDGAFGPKYTEGMRYLRSTMTEKRLSSLAVLGIESKRTKAVDLNKFVRRFAEQNGNRHIQL